MLGELCYIRDISVTVLMLRQESVRGSSGNHPVRLKCE